MSSMLQRLLNDPVILPAGSAILAVHISLYSIFRYLAPNGPWREMPSFTAHKAITVVLMVCFAYEGFSSFREPGMINVNETGIWLAQITMGALLLWDIPIGMLSAGMGDTLMQIHHVGFFIVATIVLGYHSNGVPVGSEYAPFFFGVIEISSIPLAIVTLFHPRNKPWYSYMSGSKTLQTVNGIARATFGILFFFTRVMYLPFLVVNNAIPDCLSLPRERPDLTLSLYMLLVLSIFFTLLQLFWFRTIVKQAFNMFKGAKYVGKKKE